MTTTSGNLGETAERKRIVIISLLLLAITAAVYWPVAGHGFVNFDDPDYVLSNPRIQAGLTMESIRWSVTGIYSSNWHPVTWLSHMLDCQLYGLKPAGHHLTNVAFHLANTVLLFLLLRRMTGALLRSAFVAALFALHPMHVESVAWVAERKDVLSTFFGLLCLWSYARFVQGRAEVKDKAISHLPSPVFYLLALLLFALSLMSKAMLVTLPFVMLLLDFWPLGRFKLPIAQATPKASKLSSLFSSIRPLLIEKLPFFALSLASCIITFRVQRISGAMVPLSNTPLELRLINAIAGYGWYLVKTVWPSQLAVFYPHPHLDWASWEVLVTLFLLAGITALVLWRANKQPYLPLGWFWFLGTLVPVIGLVQVGQQAWADRYSYVPQMGLFLIFAWGAAEVITAWEWPRVVRYVAAGVVLAACAAASSQQIAFWPDTITLFEHTAAVTSGNYIAYTVIGSALADKDRLPEAIEYCHKALQFSPRYPEAFNTLGNVYTKQEKFELAIENYREAIACDPSYGDAYFGLGNAMFRMQKYAEAETQCREALRLAPMHMAARFCLARALHSQEKFEEAAGHYRRLLELDPNLFSAHRYLGNVLVSQGKLDEAVIQLKSALQIRPNDADTHAVLGTVFLEKNLVEEALSQFRETTRLQPTNAAANYQLALIHQSRKQIREAIEYFHQTLQAQPNMIEALNNLAWLLAASHDAAFRNGKEAVELAERACKLTQEKEALLIGTLAAAYAEAGRTAEAVKAAEKARDLALAAGQKDVANKNSELLAIYKAGGAYHESE
jgi:tetratricopeptide (TPR) repeat protein